MRCNGPLLLLLLSSACLLFSSVFCWEECAVRLLFRARFFSSASFALHAHSTPSLHIPSRPIAARHLDHQTNPVPLFASLRSSWSKPHDNPCLD
ncbi:hypothetical protein LZ32DRAFT_79612 [Colletotrichum eremochloae]|nr:hypothetical protein LZ32DRAFT_79612 [Colletotrichum eremochloae]